MSQADNKSNGYVAFMNDVKGEIQRQQETKPLAVPQEPKTIWVSPIDLLDVQVEILNIGKQGSYQQLAVILYVIFGIQGWEIRKILTEFAEEGERSHQVVYKGKYGVAKDKVCLAKKMLGSFSICEFLIEEA